MLLGPSDTDPCRAETHHLPNPAVHAKTRKELYVGGSASSHMILEPL